MLKTLEELKLDHEKIKKEIEQKNATVAQRNDQLSSINESINSHQQEIDAIRTTTKLKEAALQKETEELNNSIAERETYFTHLLSEKNLVVSNLQQQCAKLKLICETPEPVDLADITLEDDSTLQSFELDAKQSLLFTLHKEHDKLGNTLKDLQHELEVVHKKIDTTNNELFEAHEMLVNIDLEESSLRNFDVTSVGTSLFDEVNNPRELIYDKLQSLKRELHNQRKELESKKMQLDNMYFQQTEMKEAIEMHPIECQKDLDELVFSHRNYLEMTKNLCKRLQDQLNARDKIIQEGFQKDVLKYYDNFLFDQKKIEEDLKEIGSRERVIHKLKLRDLKEVLSKIHQTESEISSISKQIIDHERNISSVTENVNGLCQKKHHLVVGSLDDKCKSVLRSANVNVERHKFKDEDKKVRFDKCAKSDDNVKKVPKAGRLLEYKTVHFSGKKKKQAS